MTTAAPVAAGPDDRTARITLLVASLATLATFLDTTILFVAFPDIGPTFSTAGAAEMSWVLNGYTIVFAALLIPVGKLADRFGHRRAFLVGSAIFTGASMACGLAPTVEVLIGFRVLQAVGAATLIPSSLALVMHAFPRDQLPRAVAIWGAAGAVAGALGPTMGSAIVEAFGWRWAFFINLPVGAFTLIAGRRVLSESSDPDTRVPAFTGVALIAAAASLLSYGVVRTSDSGWNDGITWLVIVVGAFLLAAFVVHQRSTAAPALNLDLFSIVNFRWGNLAMFAFGIGFSAMFLASILFLTEVWGWSILKAGFGVAPGPALVALLAPRFGSLSARIGQRPILIAGGLSWAIGAGYRIVMLDATPDYLVDYLPSMLLTGVGVACVFPQLSSVVAQALPANRIGIGGASLQALRQFGGTFGVALTIALLGNPDGIGNALARFDRVWWAVAIGGLVTAAFVLPMRTDQTH